MKACSALGHDSIPTVSFVLMTLVVACRAELDKLEEPEWEAE